jgi:tetratricopeptide (TPR) repeat protein
MKRHAVVFIFIFSIVVYSNSLGGAFVWDDQAFVAHNTAIKTLFNAPSFFTDPLTTAIGELAQDVYRPITTLSYAVDYFFWGLNSFGYHLTNVVIHASNGVLAFFLLSIIFGEFIPALIGSLIFISHPVQTEVVSWISGRSSVLFMFFYLSSIIFYIRSCKESKFLLYLASILAFAASLFSKEMAITLPIILILYDIHFAGKTSLKEKIIKYTPYFAIALFYISIRVFLLKQVAQFAGWGAPYTTFLTMSKVVVDYIVLLFWPVKLCAVGYDMAISKSILEIQVLFSLSVLAGLFFTLPVLFRRVKVLSFSILVFFITLFPVLNIIPIKALKAERFLYLPSLGFCIAAAYLLFLLSKRPNKPHAKISVIAVIIPTLLISAYSARTIMRNEDWRDEITIGRRAFEAYSTCAWSIATLGENYFEAGNYDEAVKYLQKAIFYSRDYDLAHHLLGMCYMKLGRFADAVDEFKKTLIISPDSGADVHSRLGVSYANIKKYNEAKKELLYAIRKEPQFIDARLNLGRIYETEGDNESAIKEYLKIIPYADNGYYRGIAYMRIGDVFVVMKDNAGAGKYYEKSIREFGQGLEKLRDIVSEKLNNLPK